MGERWVPVVGYEGLYEVSDAGRVRSLDRVVRRAVGGAEYVQPGRVLRPGTHRQGYMLVCLRGKQGKRTHKVHRLVLIAFGGDRPGLKVRHRNDIPGDNRLENLTWGTQADNMNDAVRNGRNQNARKTACIRGHSLVPPNLRRHEWETKGRRLCYACSRAQERARRQSRPFDSAEANEIYARVMRKRDGASHL